MPPTRHNKTPDKQKRWILVAAARPNFMKIAPLMRAIAADNRYNANSIQPFLVHTGQHYDDNMSDSFFRELQIPKPDVHLGIGSGTHAQQTGNVMIAFEQVLLSEKPDLVIVVGDVNSTLACALTAVKLHIPVAHVEAGLRSFDRKMPEEINRILTDALSDYLFTPSPDGDDNLLREGVAREKIFLVGDIMVDSLLFNLEKAKKTDILERLGLQSADKKKGRAGIQPYAMLTLHRPSNVDDPKTFKRILSGLSKVASKIPVIFPIHPRTRKQITAFGLKDTFVFHSSTDILHENRDEKVSNEGRIHCFDPMGYLDFLNLMAHAKMVFTDSGGIQEETTVLNIPCITLRDTTERPITLKDGTNVLAGDDPEKIIMEADNVLDGKAKKGRPIEIWDGRTAERIVEILSAVKPNWPQVNSISQAEP